MPEAGPSVERQRLHAALQSRLFGAPLKPTRIGRYVVLEPLGEGAMGTVYLALDPDLDRKVAVKVVSHRTVNELARARMQREAKVMAKLSHPNVVVVHEVGLTEHSLFIAMEYVRGGTLARWCENHSPGTEARAHTVMELAVQAARGLASAHDAGLVHRDFKPANLLIGDDGRLRVADFGLAREDDDASTEAGADGTPSTEASAPQGAGDVSGSERLTRTGQIVGTPAYMAPEQFKGRADARSDQFAWCVTFFEALLGVRPFAGANATELLDSIESGRIVGTPNVPGVPSWLVQALHRGLAVDPNARWPTMAALVAELERHDARLRWPLVGAAALVAASAGAWALAGEPSMPACTDGAQRLAEVWDDDRRDSIARAFGASGAPGAEETRARLETRLDAFASRWSDAHRMACRESRSADAEVVAVGEARTACVDRTLRMLDALAEELSTADRQLVRRAVPMTRALEDAADCDAADLAAPQRDVDPSLLAELDRARILHAARRADDAIELLVGVAQRAPSPGRLRAQVLLDITRVHAAMGHYRRTLEASDRALSAAELTDAPLVQLHAWRLQAQAAEALDDTARTDLALMRARNLASRPETHDLDRARLRWTEANVLDQRQSHAQAAPHYAAAAQVYRDGDPDDLRLASLLLDRSSNLLRTGAVEDASAAAEEAAQISERVLGPEHPRTAEALAHKARFDSLLGRAGVLSQLDRAAEIWSGWPNFRQDKQVELHETRASALLYGGDPEAALVAIDESLRIFEELDLPLVQQALALGTLRAQTLDQLGRSDDANAQYRRLLDRYGERHDVAPEALGQVRLRMVEFDLRAGSTDAALENLAAARGLLDGRYAQGSQADVDYRGQLATKLARLGQVEDALTVLPSWRTVRTMAPRTAGWIALEAAKIHHQRGEPARAREFLERARPLVAASGIPGLVQYLENVEQTLDGPAP